MFRRGRSSYRKPVRRAKSVSRVRRVRRSIVTQPGVKRHVIEGYTYFNHTFANSVNATPLLFNPLNAAYTNGFFTDHVKLMYQQWRLRKVTLKINFSTASQTANGLLFGHTLATPQSFSGPQVWFVWDPNESYAVNTGLAATTIQARKGSRFV